MAFETSFAIMRYITPFITGLLLTAFFTVRAQDNYLMPEKFFLHKGDQLTVHLLSGNEFRNDNELKYSSSGTAKFMMYEGNKKTDLMTAAKDSAAPVFSYTTGNQGLLCIELTSAPAVNEVDRDSYARFLSEQGLVKLADQVNNSNQSQFREKNTRYLKTLVTVDKPTGKDFDKQTGQDYEIVLTVNPYKLNYGEDITAVLYLKGKPVKAAPIELYIKTASGNVYPQALSADNDGQVSFTASREGIYMLRSVRTIAANSTDYDFETMQADYTFKFSSQNDSPSDYTSFGFGEKH